MIQQELQDFSLVQGEIAPRIYSIPFYHNFRKKKIISKQFELSSQQFRNSKQFHLHLKFISTISHNESLAEMKAESLRYFPLVLPHSNPREYCPHLLRKLAIRKSMQNSAEPPFVAIHSNWTFHAAELNEF